MRVDGADRTHAEVVQVIRLDVLRGDGVADPVRIVTQFWSFDGEKLAERDPMGVPLVHSVPNDR